MSSSDFIKLLRQAKIIDDSFTLGDGELVYSRTKVKSSGTKLTFDIFSSLTIPMIAERKTCEEYDVIQAICSAGRTASRSTTIPDKYVRLHDDRTTYTGVSRNSISGSTSPRKSFYSTGSVSDGTLLEGGSYSGRSFRGSFGNQVDISEIARVAAEGTSPRRHSASRQSGSWGVGPQLQADYKPLKKTVPAAVRLHDDKNTYTGTFLHAKDSPTEEAVAAVQLASLLRPDPPSRNGSITGVDTKLRRLTIPEAVRLHDDKSTYTGTFSPRNTQPSPRSSISPREKPEYKPLKLTIPDAVRLHDDRSTYSGTFNPNRTDNKRDITFEQITAQSRTGSNNPSPRNSCMGRMGEEIESHSTASSRCDISDTHSQVKVLSRVTSGHIRMAFIAFSPTAEMSSMQFMKLMRDADLLSRHFAGGDAEIIFRRSQAKQFHSSGGVGSIPQGLKITFDTFKQVTIPMIAEKKEVLVDEIARIVGSMNGPVIIATKAEETRLHDDKSTYGGASRHPSVTDTDGIASAMATAANFSPCQPSTPIRSSSTPRKRMSSEYSPRTVRMEKGTPSPNRSRSNLISESDQDSIGSSPIAEAKVGSSFQNSFAILELKDMFMRYCPSGEMGHEEYMKLIHDIDILDTIFTSVEAEKVLSRFIKNIGETITFQKFYTYLLRELSEKKGIPITDLILLIRGQTNSRGIKSIKRS